MPPVVDTGPDAGSNLVSGEGSNVLSFTMPSAPRYVVQSVVATVDNSAGGDTTAVLTMQDANGAVIAATQQDDTIAAGQTGTATFALRLPAKTGGTIRFNRANRGTWLSVIATGSDFHTGIGMRLGTTGGAPFVLDTTDNGVNPNAGAIQVLTGTFTVSAGSGGWTITTVAGTGGILEADQTVLVHSQSGNVNIVANQAATLSGNVVSIQGGEIDVNGPIGFFGVPAAGQQATPVTLGDVIALLQTFGYAA